MTSTLRRVIAVIEIIGGVSGVALMSWEISQVQMNAVLLIFALILYSLYLLSLFAGVLLWRDHRWGRIASIIVQIVQLPKIFTPVVIFNICFGVDIYPYLLFGIHGFFNIGFELKVLAFHQFHINAPLPAVGLGVSIPACIFLTALIKNNREGAAHERFYVPPPTDLRYWNASPAPDAAQDKFVGQTPAPDEAGPNNPESNN